MKNTKESVILTIDDEQVIRESVSAYLEDHDYTVLLAEDGREGLRMVDNFEVDLVLVDLRMPELSGLAVLAELQKKQPDLPVIVISGTGEIDDVVKALRLGAWDYLLKPISDLQMLLHAIGRVLEKKRLLQENRQYQINLEQLVNEKTRELSEINTRLKRVVESTKNLLGCGRLEESAELLLNEFAAHMDATGGSIYAVTTNGLQQLASLDGGHAAPLIPFPLEPGSVFHRVMEKDEPLFLDDIEKDSTIVASGGDKYRDNSLLVFPISAIKGETVAILSLHSKKRPPFSVQDHDIGTILASYAGEALQVANVSAALQNSEERLRQAHKMEAIGTLAGGISHDFNNILAAIIGYTDLSLVHEKCHDDIRRNLEQVKNAGNRAKDLVSQILAFSRTEEVVENPIDIAPIMKEAMKLLRATIPSSISIEADIPEELGKVFIDPTRIYQLLMNLCTNAAHAMQTGEGTLSVRFSPIAAYRLPGDAERSKSKDWLVLSVGDTGTGINKEDRARIFDPYFTTKEKGEGTGLGLAMVHAIVRSCGGTIKVESTPGQGSVFHLFFPSSGGEKMVVENLPLATMKGGKEHVLVIDDELVLAEMAGEMLQKLGYSVEVHTDSIESLAIFAKNPSRYDLLITDQTMPGMSGLELARETILLKPDMPVILCSGYSSAVNKKKLKDAGVKEFLMKPLSMASLAEAVRHALDSK